MAVSKLRFSIIDELFDDISDAEIINEISEKRNRLLQFKEISNTDVPVEIKAGPASISEGRVKLVKFS